MASSSPELRVASRRVARLRTVAVSPRLFVGLAVGSALSLYLILVTGATVRLTGSGLGCEHWPGCQAGHRELRCSTVPGYPSQNRAAAGP